MVKTEISLPDNLFQAADQLAKWLGVVPEKLYEVAIEEYLQAHRDEAITKALNRVYGEEESSGNEL